jgi:hypothetical protein
MPIPKPKQTIETWHISPPADLSLSVRKLAEKETRSIRNMIVVLLQEGLEVHGNEKTISIRDVPVDVWRKIKICAATSGKSVSATAVLALRELVDKKAQ